MCGTDPTVRRLVPEAVSVARSDAEILACLPVMRELRPHLDAESFLRRVLSQAHQGYEIAYIAAEGSPVAVAGYRFGETLAWGRFLYVDDLVTLSTHRSRGYGAALLDWLRHLGRSRGCRELHLDSGVQRRDAHRFYEREGMTMSSYHFKQVLAPPDRSARQGS